MTHCIHGAKTATFSYATELTSIVFSRTASDERIKQAQSTEVVQTDLTTEAVRFVAGLDMSATVADEAADRALSSVVRKLDKALSVQFTVNELIAEATDIRNLGLMYYGEHPLSFRNRIY